MNAPSPLANPILFHIGIVPVTQEVVTTWAIMAVLALVSALGTMRLREVDPGPWQTALESVVDAVSRQVRDVVQTDPSEFLPLIGTLFFFIVAANLSGLVPDVKSPTANIETPAALALTVFIAVHVYGIKAHGLGEYLAGFLKPNPLLLPLNLISEVTRTFSLMVRLFGNIMSHEIVIGIVLTLAGLFVPIPFMALSILIGLIQAYIFTVLATVFIGAAVSSQRG
jgi:F-type H+-transporting ATPase subunit a